MYEASTGYQYGLQVLQVHFLRPPAWGPMVVYKPKYTDMHYTNSAELAHVYLHDWVVLGHL